MYYFSLCIMQDAVVNLCPKDTNCIIEVVQYVYRVDM